VAICEHCGKDISTLNNVQSGYVIYEMDANGSYSQVDGFEPDGNMNEWHCPNCSSNIALCEEDAMEFLSRGVPGDNILTREGKTRRVAFKRNHTS